jgi:TolB protein
MAPRRFAPTAALLALLLVLLMAPASAVATFPGQNGGFAYGFDLEYETDDHSYTVYGWSVGLIDQDGGNRHRISSGREPAFSPDGTRLAVSQRRDWGSALVSLTGRPLARLSSGIDRAPAWAPSGRRIAFERFRCTGIFETLNCPRARGIWIVGRDGRGARRVTREGADPAWSTLGDLAFVVERDHCHDCHRAPEGQIRVRRGGAVRTLTRGSAPDWSPSGGQLAFVTGAGGLFVMNRDGSGRRRLYFSRAQASSPTWSPDGRSIAFVSGGDAVLAVPSSGGRARRLFNLPCPGSLCDDGESATVNDLAWRPMRR